MGWGWNRKVIVCPRVAYSGSFPGRGPMPPNMGLGGQTERISNGYQF